MTTTREEAIEMSREAGIILLIDSKFGREDYFSTQASWPAIIRLIELARAKENEECAKVCEEYGADRWALYKGRPPYKGNEDGRANPFVDGQTSGAEECAEVIRARMKP